MDQRLVLDTIEAQKERFLAMATEIWNRPEVAHQERHAAALQKAFFREAGFRVVELDAVQENAFLAEYGSGPPTVGLLGEYDALPGLSQKVAPVPDPVHPGGPGHGCGHNLLGTACLAAAAGVQAALRAGARRGTIRYFGCPAEEQLGKPVLARAGVFDGLDAALCWHPADVNTVAAYASNASVSFSFRFQGAAAHAAQVPHLGRSALDALTLMNIGIEFLREHMPPSARVHYVVTSGGERPNIVPESAAGEYQVRSPRMAEVVALARRVVQVADGAALMTATGVEHRVLHGCYDVLPNRVLSDLLYGHLKAVPFPALSAEEEAFAARLAATSTVEQKRATLAMLGIDAASAEELLKEAVHRGAGYWGIGWTIPASTDVGDVSHIAPTAQINAATWPVGVGSHTWQAAAASGSGLGMKGMLYAAGVLGGAAAELLSRPEVLERARAEFAAATGGVPYRAPADLVF